MKHWIILSTICRLRWQGVCCGNLVNIAVSFQTISKAFSRNSPKTYIQIPVQKLKEFWLSLIVSYSRCGPVQVWISTYQPWVPSGRAGSLRTISRLTWRRILQNARLWLAETNLRSPMPHKVDNSISLISIEPKQEQLELFSRFFSRPPP